MSIKKHIPNTLTCCNLICGCIATGYAFNSNYDLALYFIIAGAVFDFFDGFVARLLHVSSPIGKELDSLADDITFGFAPATIVYSLLCEYLPYDYWWMAYGAFLIAAFSALRLAKFNLDERQALGFIGLPTPANALFWGALAITLDANANLIPADYYLHTAAALAVGVLFSSWLLVSEVPMFALKFKQYGWRGNELRFIFLALSAFLLVILSWGGFCAIIALYVILSVLTQRKG